MAMSHQMTDISKFLRRFFQKATTDRAPCDALRPPQTYLPTANVDSVLSAYASIFLRKTVRAARNTPRPKSATRGEFAKRGFAKRGQRRTRLADD